jgi:hypothetical protein
MCKKDDAHFDCRSGHGCLTSMSALPHKWLIRVAFALVIALWGSVTMLVHNQFSQTWTADTLQYKVSSETHSSVLSCRDLMKLSPTYFSSGEFLTNPSLPHSWVSRADGSREFKHGLCEIHRYTADEARQCLVGKHVSIIGDSISRYNAISLAYFLEKGAWMPRFGLELPYCRRHDENGTAVCSKEDDPNVMLPNNFLFEPSKPQDFEKMDYFWAKLGGWTDGGSTFNGRLECNCPGQRVECMLYVTPELPFASERADDVNQYAKRVVISFNFEKGLQVPAPIIGFNFTGCALTGTCRHNQADSAYWTNRSEAGDLDWQQDLPEFLSPNGAFASQLPPVDIAIYNRGLWGEMPAERSKQVLPLLYNYSGGAKGQCFYRTTVHLEKRVSEMNYVRADTLTSGCSFFDFAGISEHFMELQAQRNFHLGDVNWTMILPEQEERYSVFHDDVHYQPWLYEEYNNLWLNVLCNAKTLS